MQIERKEDPETLMPHEDKSREYRAMRGKRTGGNRVLRLQFVPNLGTHNRRLPLSDLHLQDVTKDGTELILEFSSHIAILRGRALDVVDDGISDGWVAAVEAFDPARRDMPSNRDAPFITSIDFYPRSKPENARPPRSKPRLVKADE